jgi:hypothetical protein
MLMSKGAKKPKANPTPSLLTATGTVHREGDWLSVPLRSEWRDVAAKRNATAYASDLATHGSSSVAKEAVI